WRPTPTRAGGRGPGRARSWAAGRVMWASWSGAWGGGSRPPTAGRPTRRGDLDDRGAPPLPVPPRLRSAAERRAARRARRARAHRLLPAVRGEACRARRRAGGVHDAAFATAPHTAGRRRPPRPP